MAGRTVIVGDRRGIPSDLLENMSDHGFGVTFADNLPAALKACRETSASDLIIIDDENARAGTVISALRLHPTTMQRGLIVLTDTQGRLPAMSAGADDVFPAEVDADLLIARLRSLRARQTDRSAANTMAEGAATFLHQPKIALVANGDVATAWKTALSPHMDADFCILSASECLARADGWESSDLYIISSDLIGQGDGLRLLSVLREKPASADAAFMIALAASDGSLAPVALDLGAGDVLPLSLQSIMTAEEVTIRIKNQLRFRAEAQTDQPKFSSVFSRKDALTGLPTRTHALVKKTSVIEGITKNDGIAAVIVLAIDDFDKFIALHGKKIGDVVIKAIASELNNLSPPPALSARIGRNEFMIVTSVNSACDAFTQAEEIRRNLQHAIPPFGRGKKAANSAPSLSAGLAVSLSNDTELAPQNKIKTPAPLLASADLALLSAKHKGGNRTEAKL